MVSRELYIHASAADITIALLEDKKLVELHKEKPNNDFSVGDLYLGKVKKLVPGLNAAFVNVGYEKDAFLHYFDLGPQAMSALNYCRDVRSGALNAKNLDKFKLAPDIDKGGKIADVLKPGQEILVQIAKEPISTKGPRISCELSIAGRYLVLVPFSDRISVSQKIKDKEERDRLRKLLTAIKPKGFGVIARTVTENKKSSAVEADLNDLMKKWEENFSNLKKMTPPSKVLGEIDRTNAILRDLLNSSFNNIVVDDEAIYNDIREYLRTIAPDKEGIVKLHKQRTELFETFGIERQIKGSFGKHVTMHSGAYLVVEHTEALHVIDVNSGNTAKSESTQEENALKVNIEAASEISRQLRLRDMGGIIVIDFIDMQKAENKKMLYNHLNEVMKADRAKHHVLPPSKFGLVQITRQRVRPEMDITTSEKCPSCGGTGEVQASILIIDEIQNNLRYLIEEKKVSELILQVHPFIASHIKKGFPSLMHKWWWQYKKRIRVEGVMALPMLDYRFVNNLGDEITQ